MRKAHIMLDKETGLDPPGIKLRAAQGFDATDFFITGYWIWNKILENLASLGYDPTNSFTAAYDWRLSYPNLEVRDHYFTRGSNRTSRWLFRSNRGKVVPASHSMGSQVVFYFFSTGLPQTKVDAEATIGSKGMLIPGSMSAAACLGR